MENYGVVKALEFLENNPDLDLRSFEHTNEYRMLNNSIPLSKHLGSVYSGLPIVIDGDLESIVISNRNEITLIILYDLVGREKQYARVIFNSSNKVDFIRKELLPMTHICLAAKYTKNFREYKGKSILIYNRPLLYGHYICADCGYDHGINKGCEDQYCDICADEAGGKLMYVTDYYRFHLSKGRIVV